MLVVLVVVLLLLSDMVFEFSTVTFRLILDILQDWKHDKGRFMKTSVIYHSNSCSSVSNRKLLIPSECKQRLYKLVWNDLQYERRKEKLKNENNANEDRLVKKEVS